jgi:hypothetical protein
MSDNRRSYLLDYQRCIRWLILSLSYIFLLISCTPSATSELEMHSTDTPRLATLAVTQQSIQIISPTAPMIQTSQPGTSGREEIVKPTASQPAIQPPSPPTMTPSDTPRRPLVTTEDAIHAVQSQYPAVADISDMPDTTIGKSEDIYVQPQENGWRLIFWMGWGDCPAGCINSHYWYFTVGTDGAIELAAEYERVYEPGLSTFRETGEPLWGIPR